jgi:hypothetical protein
MQQATATTHHSGQGREQHVVWAYRKAGECALKAEAIVMQAYTQETSQQEEE